MAKTQFHAGCSNSSSSKAAGESKPEAYPQGYVEDFDEPRTKLADCFSILTKNGPLLCGTLALPSDRSDVQQSFSRPR